MHTIQIKTASAAYPAYIGSDILANFGSRLRRVAGAGGTALARGTAIFVLTSPAIWSLWGRKFSAGLRPHPSPTILFLPPGEQHKRLSQLDRLATEMAAAGADRSSLLIAFGGGIVGDVAGFLAAMYMRGIPYVQVPTTLLAQVDSSVGGKTGANLASGKNLVGAFYHPLAVFADTGVLGTLPQRELRAGLFESIKAGIIRDAALFRYLERNREAVLAGDPAALQRVIGASVAMKAKVVGIDERESGLRMILNFGHTIGHAIEAATGYKRLLHGEAIAWGMLAALHISRSRALIAEQEAMRMEELIRAYGPLPRFRVSAAALIEAAGRDKKNNGGTRRFVLTEGIGKARVVEDVTVAELNSAVSRMLREAAK